MSKNGPLALLFNALVISFMLAPLLIVCIVAFTPANTLTIPTTQVSLRWFKAVFAHPDFVTSFWNSLWLALSSATLATLIAIPAGLALTRFNFAGREALNALFLSPAVSTGWCWPTWWSSRPMCCVWWWPHPLAPTAVASRPRSRSVPAAPRSFAVSPCP